MPGTFYMFVFLVTFTYLMILSFMRMAPVSHVVVVRNVSSMSFSLFGIRWFKEKTLVRVFRQIDNSFGDIFYRF